MKESTSMQRDIDRDARLSEGPQAFQIDEQVERLRSDESYREAGKSSIILARKEHLRVVLSALEHAKEMEPHHTAGPFALHVLEGSVQVNWDDQSSILREHDLLTFPAGIEHSVQALEDTAFLLTLFQPTEPTVNVEH
jgi:quercetin dioxygenase-like cupin family protein